MDNDEDIFEPAPQKPAPKPRTAWKPQNIAGGLFLLLGAGLAGYVYFSETNKQSPRLGTSDSEEFQEAESGGGFGVIEAGPEPEPEMPSIVVDTTGFEEEQERLAAENAALARRLEELQQEVAAGVETGSDAETRSALEEMRAIIEAQEEAIKAEREVLRAELEASRNEITALMEQQIEAERLRRAAEEEARNTSEAERLAEMERMRIEAEQEAQRRAELEARRQQAEEERIKRIQSPSVVFDDGQSIDGGGGASGTSDAASAESGTSEADMSRDDRARAFAEGRISESEVEGATVIANPSNTVLQGTMIQATLETAMNSSLPGQSVAVVNYDIYSFDGSQVLIPRGSKLIGEYSSDVDLGQSRILAVWTRVVTPDGNSVNLRSYGGDQLGVSGISGRINRKFLQRFGSAALISIVSAAPVAVSASADSGSIRAELSSNVGENLQQATQDSVGQYLTIPQEILINQGSMVSVLVDRDLEIWP